MKKIKKNKEQSISKIERRRDNEAQIMAAAEEVFANRGFKGATVNEIADKAGLPKANVLYYFSSKLNLYRRVIETVLTAWLEAADEVEDWSDPRQTLTHYLHRKMDLSRSHPNGSKVWANEIMHGAPIIRDYLATHLRQWVHLRESRIRKWIDDGLIRDVNPRYVLYMIWATTQHYADFYTQIEVLNDDKPLADLQFEEAKQVVTDIILNGLLLKKP